jgi:hypothetical protein
MQYAYWSIQAHYLPNTNSLNWKQEHVLHWQNYSSAVTQLQRAAWRSNHLRYTNRFDTGKPERLCGF